MVYALIFATFAIAATIWYPPIGICIHLLLYDFVSANETFAFLGYGSNTLPLILLLIPYFGSVYRIAKWYKTGKATPGMLVVACLVLAGVGYAACSIFAWAHSDNVNDYITYVVESGPLLVLPVIAYGQDKRARVLVAATVVFQMALAFLIIHFPVGILADLNAANYHRYASAIGGIGSSGNVVRAVGQFSTAIQFSAYATMCFAIGCFMFVKSQGLSNRALAICIIALGLWGEYISFTRGVLISLIFALILTRFPLRGLRSVAASVVVMALAVSAFYVVINTANSTASKAVAGYLGEMADPQSESVGYRTAGMHNAMTILEEQPAFGLCNMKAVISRGEICHFYPLWFASVYGLPAGLAVLCLLWYALLSDIRRRRRDGVGERHPCDDRFLGTIFGWTAVVLLSSNFMGGRSLTWLMLGFACMVAVKESAVARRRSPQADLRPLLIGGKEMMAVGRESHLTP